MTLLHVLNLISEINQKLDSESIKQANFHVLKFFWLKDITVLQRCGDFHRVIVMTFLVAYNHKKFENL